MKPRAFFHQLLHDDIVAAIRAAEGRTSGEIRVSISRRETGDAFAAAREEFGRLGMAATRERNGVLLFISPRSHQFAIIGDTAIHEKCGDAFWQEVAAEMSAHFKQGNFTTGLTHAIHKAGEILARHFPRQSGDQNELSDSVVND